MNRVTIGCIVRNRAWVLPDYLAALAALEYPVDMFLFLENDSEDETHNVLLNWAEKTWTRVPVMVGKIDTGAEKWDHHDYAIDQYANLAKLRNRFVERFLQYSEAEYLFSVDSDIIVQPDTLTKLMQAAEQEPRTIIAAPISNIADRPLFQEIDGVMTPGNFLVETPGGVFHPDRYPSSGLFDVYDTGAVYIIPREVLEAGVRYGQNPQGEDMAFCIQAEEKGFKRKVLMDAVCEHRMKKPEVK